MKPKILLLSLLLLFTGVRTNAQLLKKLKNAVKQGVEVLEGDIDETDDKNTDKGSRKATAASPPANKNASNPTAIPGMETIAAPQDQNVQLPDSYHFSYKATLKVTSSSGTVEPIFYLEPGASYYARNNTIKELTEYLVMDNQINMAVLFGEFQGQKRRIHNYFNLETKATLMGAYRDAPRTAPVTPLKDKSILGYDCTGYQITTETGTTKLWITNQAPVTMFSTLFTYRSHLPDSPFTENSMIMEVVFDSASDPEKSYQMVCTALQPEKLVLRQSDYQQAQ